MPGKRIIDTSLTRTTFIEAVANNAELLTDWETGNPSNELVWARPIPIKLIGNSWMQASYDAATWSNTILDDHDYLRVSTDGGTTWRIIDLTGSGDSHPPVTIGSPDGGLSIVADTQILTLNPASDINAGSMSAPHYTKLEALKFDIFQNVGGGAEIYKDYTDLGDDRTHDIKTLISSDGSVIFTQNATTIDLQATGAGGGESNTASNYGTDGVGPYDSKNGVDLRFRNVAVDAADTLGILSITLDATDHDIDFFIDHTVIPHDELDGYVPDEHVDHSTVSILTTEGIQGGGDITANRTLTLEFDGLGVQTTLEDSDVFAFYRNESGEDLHYSITYANLKADLNFPETVPLYASDGVKISGNDLLASNQTVSLAINTLPTVTYTGSDYVAIYDVSNFNHAKITLSDLIGELAVSITAGDGMDFTTITSTGPVTLGTPSELTKTTIDEATGTTHTHSVDLSTWDLVDIGDVDGSPVSGEYLKWNGTIWVTDDPTIGASAPGAPVNSIQFNDASTFGGNSGLLYYPTTDTINFTDPNASSGASFIFGADTSDPYLATVSTNGFLISNYDTTADYIRLYSNRLLVGDVVAETDYYIGIVDPNTTEFEYLLRARTQLGADLMMLKNDGAFYLPGIDSATEDNILYYNTATGLITYGAAPTGSGGGVSTLVADALSGLMVNGGSTSSAATIELDQNDSKLTSAVASASDYIGFYDVSGGIQSKTLISGFPGWNLLVNGVSEQEIQPSDDLDFYGTNGITVDFDSSLNRVTIQGSGSSACSQLVADLGTLSTGTANLDLDVYSGAVIELTGGGTITISMDNLEEGDTGHIEVTHTGAETLVFSATPDIRIALNSYEDSDTVALTPTGGIDVVAFWYSSNYLHLAVIYDMRG